MTRDQSRDQSRDQLRNIFQDAYPVQLKKIYIISPPFWFTPTMRVLSGLLRDRVRHGIEIVTPEQLLQRIPRSILPKSLGGTLRVNHVSWINQCLFAHSKRAGSAGNDSWQNGRRPLFEAECFRNSDSDDKLTACHVIRSFWMKLIIEIDYIWGLVHAISVGIFTMIGNFYCFTFSISVIFQQLNLKIKKVQCINLSFLDSSMVVKSTYLQYYYGEATK